MANQEHVGILQKGAKVWNEWRRQNPHTRPDLFEAGLSEANLREANLRGANLARTNLNKAILFEADLSKVDLHGARLVEAHLNSAKLRWADLHGADLLEANLGKANLSGANLSRADLRSANLGGAKLSRANLWRADLSRANLSGAKLNSAHLNGAELADVSLHNANLTDASMANTVLANVDLSSVKGLETVRHFAPSTVGIDTIYRSKGNIPETFLRAVGVPEPFIVQMKALVGAMQPIQFYSCFISYSSKDNDFAQRLYADLQQRNVRCWFAPEDMKIGDKIRHRIDEAIRVHDKLLLVLTKRSVKSVWVEKEVETAFEKERKQGRTALFPIRLDDALMDTDEAWAADLRRTRHIGDFRKWKDRDEYQKAFARLMRDLQAGG